MTTTVASTAACELSDVTVTFDTPKGAVNALAGISLEIHAGEVFCLLGPNGAGKTTIINVLCGLVAPTSGAVRVTGLDPSDDRRAVLAQTALMPQETALYERLSAEENLVFHASYYGVPRKELRGRIDRAIEVVGLTDRLSDRVETFSGGMRRRLALARALLTEARVVLLDEPTLGVDVQSRNAIWDQVRALAATGVAVVLTTNYMEEADALADTIQLIDGGAAVVAGTPEELKARVGGQRLRLRFESEGAARQASERLGQEGRAAVDVDHRVIDIGLNSAQEAVREFEHLGELLGRSLPQLERFELNEPSLQEVFLHFTGRALRD